MTAGTGKPAPLRDYVRKRRHAATSSEPVPHPAPKLTIVRQPLPARARFCVQEHRARRLHYDFRLEMGGVLKSWALPKGPSLDPEVRRLAVATEDHPLDYLTFEGRIEQGSYGAGEVLVWDLGDYEILGDAPPLAQWRVGRLKFILHGEKLNGEFALVRLAPRASAEADSATGEPADHWLMIKKRDAAARFGDTAARHPGSALRGRMQTVPADPPAPRKDGPDRQPAPNPPEPMLATLGDRVFSDPNWFFEIKWDGIRAFARCHNDAVQLFSRTHRDLTPQYPDLARAPFRHDALLDGEIVALDPDGRSSFARLQQRMNLASAADIARAAAAIPAVYYAFDLLWLDGRDLTRLPLRERKEKLAQLTLDAPPDVHWRYSDHVEGGGVGLFELARRRGLEGVVAKRADAPYTPGRGRDWIKFKVHHQQEAVIVGYTDPQGSRTSFGALLLALYDPGRKAFVYAGRVGAGFDAPTRRHILARLRAAPPAVTGAPGRYHAVAPELVAEVRFAQWTAAGLLRAPVFLGLRTDKSPRACRREIPAEVVHARQSRT